MSYNNNGLIHTGEGTIHGAYAIKANHQGLNQAVGQGVASGAITPQEHAQIHAERQHIGQMMQAAKADGTVTGAERAQIRHAQGAVAMQIDNFEAGSAQPC